MHVQLTSEMIATANLLFLRMNDWRAIVRAFQRLHEGLPDFTYESVLLKVASVNAYYGTNVYALERMSLHITQLAI